MEDCLKKKKKQLQYSIALTLVRMAINKKSANNKCWRMEKETPLYAVGGNVNWFCHNREHSGVHKITKNTYHMISNPYYKLISEENK